MPAVVRIVWPTAPTITTPARSLEVASTAMRLLAEASTTLARMQRAGGGDLVDAECLSRSEPASGIARARSARSLTTAARASKLGPSDGQWGLVILAVPIGTLLGLMLLTRLITRTGARLLAVPRAVVLLLITPLAALSTSRVRRARPHNPVWAAPEPEALPTPLSHALTVPGKPCRRTGGS